MTTVAPVLTIDGPGGAGKGTISRMIAEHMGWHLLDSGALYRLTALSAMRNGVAVDDAEALSVQAQELDVVFAVEDGAMQILLEGDDVTTAIRSESVGNAASQVAALPPVRAALLQRQRDFCKTPGLVADGRDMGTVVFPDAPLKIYLTASAEERARRRLLQLQQAGEDARLSTLLEEIQARDARDMQRSVAPLKPAEDAVELDTTQLDIPEVVERIETLLAERKLA
ncbi:MAG: cytidylate kinase [Salinicola sp.]|uniref:(d)CMP kinase n=1 Tax=Salinicola sp. TaxID=1978524 RepID=UPI000C90E4A6|nr:(d)CMP kinase [Salinicola sp.]MAM56910.1 cytidylate kinase [Salinicola sp.]NRB58121.1 (d)CMP kinase [Salinicola sp.]